MTISFTIGFIEKLPFAEGNNPGWHWDAKQPGLGLKVTKTRKTFIAQARQNGVSKRTTLGAYPNIGLPLARKLTMGILKNIAEGIDPTKEKKRHEAHAITVGEVYKRYLEEKSLKATTKAQHESRWPTSLSALEKRPIADITRKDVETLFDGIKSKAKANLVMGQFRSYHKTRRVLGAEKAKA